MKEVSRCSLRAAKSTHNINTPTSVPSSTRNPIQLHGLVVDVLDLDDGLPNPHDHVQSHDKGVTDDRTIFRGQVLPIEKITENDVGKDGEDADDE